MSNIGIDLQPLISPSSKNRGIGIYAYNHIKEILNICNGDIAYYLFNYKNNFPFQEREYVNITNLHLAFGFRGLLLKPGLKSIFGRNMVTKLLRAYNIDLFHCTSPFDMFNIFEAEWYEGRKVIATVYDLIPSIFPSQYLPNPKAEDYYNKRIKFLVKADRLLAISESVKKDLVSLLSIPDEKIDVIYAGIDKDYQPINVQSEFLKTKYGIEKHFIMSTGGTDFRKNLPKLIEAYSIISEKYRKIYDLAIICKLTTDEENELRRIANKFKVGNSLHLTNYISKEDLIKFYNLATLFVFPSLYEGFGLPVLEAMSCGAPVVVSNTSSLPEIVGDAGILVDPNHVESIKNGLELALADEAKRKELSQKGLLQASKFTWEKVARLTIEAYSKTLKDEKRKEFINP